MIEIDSLLAEPLSSVEQREQETFDRLIADAGGAVVLFGAGGLGKNTLACLRSVGIEPLAVTDNNRALWGTQFEGVDVVSPETAAARFGDRALFIVAIWNPFHWYRETRDRLSALGCRRITAPSPVYWRFPDRFLPFYTQDFPHKVYEQADEVRRAAGIWGDDRSRQEYLQQVLWRAKGEWTFTRPSKADAESYFLPDVFGLIDDEVFVDCGAFDGDTLRPFLCRRQDRFRRYIAIEPGRRAFEKLQEYVDGLPEPLREKIQTLRCVVGAERAIVPFEDTGDMGSKPSSRGSSTIECVPISELTGASAPITFVKMDIEGTELEALRGARPAIESRRPVLAVCVYHLQHDLWRLPLFMKEMVPEYRMFLRCHEGDGWQTVAYAVPPERCEAGKAR
ncbi:MAG TPA: FkbM family methyltransferase [Vicinamibacterales bacterium]|jgi:FkbM family methyltransferase|nr:FkbM family methyltransferase [Vicinamibacterales bacterium]